MDLIAVGPGGSFPQHGMGSSCYVAQVPRPGGKTFNVVLDIGGSGLQNLSNLLIDPARDIDAVCISHPHIDHTSDVPHLAIQHQYHPEGPFRTAETLYRPIPLFGPPGITQALLGQLNPMLVDGPHGRVMGRHQLLPEERLRSTFDIHELHEGEFRVGPLTVRFAPVNHFHSEDPTQSLPAVAMRLTDEAGTSLTYSGDTDVTPRLVELATGTDLFLCEAPGKKPGIHMAPADVADIARQARVRGLVLTHFSPAWGQNIVQDQAEVARRLAEGPAPWRIPVWVAWPGQRFSVDDPWRWPREAVDRPGRAPIWGSDGVRMRIPVPTSYPGVSNLPPGPVANSQCGRSRPPGGAPRAR